MSWVEDGHLVQTLPNNFGESVGLMTGTKKAGLARIRPHREYSPRNRIPQEPLELQMRTVPEISLMTRNIISN